MKSKFLVIVAALTIPPANATIANAQWVPTNGPAVNGSVQIGAIAAIGSNLFAGDKSTDHVFRSTNNGTLWIPATTGLGLSQVSVFTVSGTNLYVAGGNLLFLSTDSGLSWTEQGAGLPTNVVIVALAVSGGNLLAATNTSGVFLSTNNGISWDSTDLPAQPNGQIYAFATIGTNLFAGGYTFEKFTSKGCIFLSTNNGATWTATDTGSPSVSMFAVSGTNLFAVSRDGVFLSTNNGTSWTSASNGLYDSSNRAYLPIYSLTVSGTNLFAGTDSGVFLSTSNGASWKRMSTDSAIFYSFAVIGSELFGIGTYDVYRSTDSGADWTVVNGGLPNTTDILALTVSGTNLLAGGESYDKACVFLTSDSGASWTPAVLPTTSGTSVLALAVNGTNIFAGTDNGGVFHSTNSGTNWVASNKGLTNIYVNNVTALAMMGSNLFAGLYGIDGGGVYRSTDSGASWAASNDGLTNPVVTSLAVLGTNLFVGTSDEGTGSKNDGVYLSTNSGTDWTPTSMTNTPVGALGVLGTDLFAVTGGVYHSTDNGTSWTSASNGLPNNRVYAFSASGTNLFAGTDSGVYLSTNYGSTWTQENNGLTTDSNIYSLAIYGSNLYAGTSSCGVWRCPLSDFGISSVAQTPVAAQTEIHSFPNPFTQSTEITFTTQAAGYAEVSIVNALGAEVARLYSGTLGAGNHSFAWDAARMSAPRGVYWCVVKRNGRVETAPIALVR